MILTAGLRRSGLHFLTSTLFLAPSTTAVLYDAESHTYDRALCQSPTPNPLTGCPPHTLLVSNSNTSSLHSHAFTTIQSAILSIRNTTHPSTILILPGTYTEQLNITTPHPLTLLGQAPSPHTTTSNTVTVLWRQATGNNFSTIDNAFTSVLTVAPNLNASLTGSGPTGFPVPDSTPFGSTNFRVYNLNFVNAYAPYAAGPALAISISRSNASFYYSTFHSYQDTVYIGKLGNSYFHECEIAGQTDFLYGFGTAWVQGGKVVLRGCGGGVVAWKGTNTTWGNGYGCYVRDAVVEKENGTLSIQGRCALGRPWNAQHRSVFANCSLDDSIRSEGYVKWGTTDDRFNFNTTMAEWRNYGPGFNLTGRLAANITRVFNDEEYEPYSTPEKVFEFPFTGARGNTAWIDRNP